MSIKLLPASVNPGDPSQAPDVSTSLVSLTQRAITTGAGETGRVSSADTLAWSSSSWSSSSWSSGARRGEAPFIDATPVEDSPSDNTSHKTTDETGGSGWEYVSGWAWSGLAASAAVAHYLLYAASPVSWGGRLINVYA